MPDFVPLGKLAAFRNWRGPRPWGPDDAWQVTFGSGREVVDDLVRGLAELPSLVRDRWSQRAEPHSVVVGCTPWLTSVRVAKTLAAVNSCIVVDKSAADSTAIRLLVEADRPVWQVTLGLGFWGPRDAEGRPPILGPYSQMPGEERGLGPVRVLGFRGNSTDRSPLLHAKLAVCCGGWTGEDDFGGEVHGLTPLRVWLGSANWTAASTNHIEFGAWTADRSLCEHALEFMQSVLQASEPLTSTSAGPLPEMVEAEYDDVAMAEAAAESAAAYEDYDFDDD